MRIKWSPQIDSPIGALSIFKSGDVIVINGDTLDFSPLAEGMVLPRAAIASPYVANIVKRIDGELIVPLVLPVKRGDPESVLFPADSVDVPDGPVELPS